MAKLRSTLPNIVLSLTAISLVLSVAIGFVYVRTKDPIALAKQNKIREALVRVLPEFNNDPFAERTAVFDVGDSVYLFPAKMKGRSVGTAVQTFTRRGFNGYIGLLVGLLPDGSIYKTEVLEQKETLGLGSRMTAENFRSQFEGKNTDRYKLSVRQDGGDVDAITAATISSRAFCDALDRAVSLYKKASGLSGEEVAIADTFQLTSVDPLKEVMPAFDNDPLASVRNIDGKDLYVGKKGEKVTGYAAKTFSKGYNEAVPLCVLTGFDAKGSIKKVVVLRQKESKGRGTQACEEEFLSQFEGQNPETFILQLSDDGGSVDGISGCTVSASAVCRAVDEAYKVYRKGGAK